MRAFVKADSGIDLFRDDCDAPLSSPLIPSGRVPVGHEWQPISRKRKLDDGILTTEAWESTPKRVRCEQLYLSYMFSLFLATVEPIHFFTELPDPGRASRTL